jgi:hypothetical protein
LEVARIPGAAELSRDHRGSESHHGLNDFRDLVDLPAVRGVKSIDVRSLRTSEVAVVPQVGTDGGATAGMK